ncbi:MAG: UDP-N-acetylmuramate--L-alanine ligase [Acidobacteriota bacterium]
MRIHMMAVGGTGMGALAGLLKAQGHDVTGCDTVLYPPMSEAIARYGIPVEAGYDPGHLQRLRPDLLVIGNSIHADNPEAQAALADGVPYCSMAEAVRRFAVEGRKSLVVAGTHGKTTTTALAGWLLESAAMRPNLLVGGIVKGWEASFRWGDGTWTVLEGDEYETAFFDKGPKFLHYAPSILILNNIEMDHLDNFADLSALETAFVRLFGVVNPGGTVLAGTESPSVARLLPQVGRRTTTFGLGGGEDWTATDVTYSEQGTRFFLFHSGRRLGAFTSPLHGPHNLRNTLAALAASLEAGAELEALKEGLASFPGVRRRQEVLHAGRCWAVVDDFAHHPTALRETLKALRQRFPGRRVTACFEPRSYTCQTALHQGELPGALSLADEVWIGPLPAPGRIPSGSRLDVERVVRDIESLGRKARALASAEEYEREFEAGALEPGLVAFFSSGAFHGLPQKLAGRLALLDEPVCGGKGIQ